MSDAARSEHRKTCVVHAVSGAPIGPPPGLPTPASSRSGWSEASFRSAGEGNTVRTTTVEFSVCGSTLGDGAGSPDRQSSRAYRREGALGSRAVLCGSLVAATPARMYPRVSLAPLEAHRGSQSNRTLMLSRWWIRRMALPKVGLQRPSRLLTTERGCAAPRYLARRDARSGSGRRLPYSARRTLRA